MERFERLAARFCCVLRCSADRLVSGLLWGSSTKSLSLIQRLADGFPCSSVSVVSSTTLDREALFGLVLVVYFVWVS